MGGSPSVPDIALVDWRGCLVSKDMVGPLNALAASVSPYVKPIRGFGSYRDNAASGGTDGGSGHVDIYANTTGWTDAERSKFVANGRRMGFEIFERKQKWYSPIRRIWLSEDWAWHFHLLLKDSADMSDGARKQLNQWYAGSNGLAGFWWNGVYRYDPDEGPRQYLRQTWTQYKASIATNPTTAEENDMQLDDVVKLRTGGSVAYSSDTTSVEGILTSTNYYLLEMKQESKARDLAQNAQITALSAAVQALSQNVGLDPAAVQSAVDKAVRESLDNLRIVDLDPEV